MNCKAFVVLFFTVALIGAVHATGSIDTNVYNGSLNVPLLVATGLGLQTIIPLIGAIILLILLGPGLLAPFQQAANESAAASTRSQRSVENVEEKMDGIIALIRSMDQIYGNLN